MPNPRICTIGNCDKRAHAKGLCANHYYRLRVRETPLFDGEKTMPGDAQNFIEKAAKYQGEECLIWPFAKIKRGYGKIGIGGKTLLVHRVVCEAAHGKPPSDDHEAAHFCGNGHLACVAGSHLRWATAKENKADQLIHGTRLRGETQNGAKLTKDEVLQIRSLADYTSGIELSKMFGVSRALVSLVINKKIWGWL